MLRAIPRRAIGVGLLTLCAVFPAGLRAAPPKVAEVVTQTRGGVTYFYARFETPDDLRRVPQFNVRADPAQVRRILAGRPRLVPQDEATRCVVCLAGDAVRQPGHPLQFAGVWRGEGRARFRLMYPVQPPPPANGRGADKQAAPLVPPNPWAEFPVVLDLGKAKTVTSAARPENRGGQIVDSDDLQGLWALGLAKEWAALEAYEPDFGFYGVARTLTARKYGVRAPAIQTDADAAQPHRLLYETGTGAAAIAESLALRRLLDPRTEKPDQRCIPVNGLPAIDVAQHPWEKMMEGRTPAPEPLAALVPHDNYYVRFRDLNALLSFGELLDLWGTSLLRAYEFQSRDYQLRQRYETQLCLPSGRIARAVSGGRIKEIAVTGSDLFLREGSDLAVIVRTDDPAKLLQELTPFLDEARREYGTALREGKWEYLDVPVESFSTPNREVSLHRAVVGKEYVVYANSRVGMRRILETVARKRQALADARDFRYMRTVFRADDRAEDGFCYLSDAFIRRQVSPADKIKEKRRLEARATLSLATNAALFAALESGKVPADTRALLDATALKADDLAMPDGKNVTWDGKARLAASEVYGTLHFSTPLIELPIDEVTADESGNYRRFRDEYLRLWNRFYDPVGVRLSLQEKQVRMEAYVLPLIQSSEYNRLRELTGGGTLRFDPAQLPRSTLMQLLLHFSLGEQDSVVGNWFAIRLDDSPLYRKRVEALIRRDTDPANADRHAAEAERLLWQLPVAVGFATKKPDEFADQMRNLWNNFNLGRGEPKRTPYKGVTITRFEVEPERFRQFMALLRTNGLVRIPMADYLPGKEVPEALYQAVIDNGYYVSTQEDCLKRLIDHAQAKKKSRPDPSAAEVNTSLWLRPGAPRTADAIELYLEYETHRRSLPNCPAWGVLYRAGVIGPGTGEAERREAARRWFGFVPVSPDGIPYAYDLAADEVRNLRHGSLRQPHVRPTVADSSPLRQLLDQFRTLRVDLRFREDGIHTTLLFGRMRRE